MAEKTKKGTSKKPSAKPKSTKKKTTSAAKPKTSSTKKAAPKKATKPTVKKKATTKKTVAAKPTKTDQAKKVDKKPWALYAIVGIILIVVLLGLVSMFGHDKDHYDKDKDKQTFGAKDESAIHLIVIEDPQCGNCQVDLYVSQIRENLFDNMEVEKVEYTSPNGAAIVREIQSPYLPLYLFDSKITQREEWEINLKNAFAGSVTINGEEYYLLNPQVVQSKKLIVDLPVLEETIAIGDENAPLTFYAFTDYECAFCAISEGNEEYVAQFRIQQPNFEPPIPKIFEEYVDTGLVRFVTYNYHPLHPTARDAHRAALCAHEQGEWREYNELLFMNQQEWSRMIERDAKFVSYAIETGLDRDEFETCLASGKFDQQIENEIFLGQQLDIQGTPTFVVDDIVVQGVEDYVNLKAIIDSKLSS